MPRTRTQRPLNRKESARQILLAAMCVCVLGCEGCMANKRPAFRFKDVALAHPIFSAPRDAVQIDPAPDLPVAAAAMPPRLGTFHAVPPRPPHTAPPATAVPAQPERVAEPIIAPGLSAEELASAKVEAYQSVDRAQRNLAAAQGTRLNAQQKDLKSKAQGFLEAAREAMKRDDWSRARNFSKKAEVLSQELVDGL